MVTLMDVPVGALAIQLMMSNGYSILVSRLVSIMGSLECLLIGTTHINMPSMPGLIVILSLLMK